MNQYTKVTFNYPELYTDFADGLNVEDSEINEWVQESLERAVNKLYKNNLDESFSTCSSGNTKVFVEVYRHKENKAKISVSVSVSQNYKIKSNYDEKIDNILTFPNTRQV